MTTKQREMEDKIMKDKIYDKYIKKEKIEIQIKDNAEYIPHNIFLLEQILKGE